MSRTDWIERRPDGSSGRFIYVTADGRTVRERAELDYFRSLAIPPAWKDACINPARDAKVLANGYDAAGRKQAVYHPAYRAEQDKAKFERILAFASKLPGLRKQVQHDLARRRFDKAKVVACAVKLMDEAYFRVGNDTYARQHHTYGVTTLRRKHADIRTTGVTFDFTGKSGQSQHQTVNDRQLARVLKQLDELPGYELFRYVGHDGAMHDIHAPDVNAYIKQHMADAFTAKDFRTWGGTLLAAIELSRLGRAATERERKKQVTASVRQVAKRLGNTPAVCRASYIDPRVINSYMDSEDLPRVRRTVAGMRPRKYMSDDERYVLELLRAGR